MLGGAKQILFNIFLPPHPSLLMRQLLRVVIISTIAYYSTSIGVVVVVVVVVYIFRPVEPNARFPKGIGRPAACLAYLS
jgi:hypothetical protein